jgi:hypothetical protein
MGSIRTARAGGGGGALPHEQREFARVDGRARDGRDGVGGPPEREEEVSEHLHSIHAMQRRP